ncbi:hypothetical protein KUCAC02_006327, partial [Chaenocephalus aceratus]
PMILPPLCLLSLFPWMTSREDCVAAVGIVLVTFLALPGLSRPSAATLVYCPIMTLSTATIRPLIARCRLPQWLNGGVMERRIRPVVILKSLEALSYLAVCAGELFNRGAATASYGEERLRCA